MTEERPSTTPVTGDRPAGVMSPSDPDITGVVEAAGRFRIYLGAAAGVGKTSNTYSLNQ